MGVVAVAVFPTGPEFDAVGDVDVRLRGTGYVEIEPVVETAGARVRLIGSHPASLE